MKRQLQKPWLLFAIGMAILPPTSVFAQKKVGRYEECRLEAIYPAGGQQGTDVTVTFFGNNGGLDGAKTILIDGPPGITVSDVKNTNVSTATAKFTIAADAAPGRRMVRVVSERSGITNMAHFVVGQLAETLEKEPNNELTSPQKVIIPQVVNGRVDPATDVDCYRFTAKQGQRVVAAVLAHAIDVHGQGSTSGIADANLEILDERGRVLAEAGDTLGLDPLVEFVAPSDGEYVARVGLVEYQGFPQAVYRLALGDIPFATAVFPPGGQRGATTDVQFFGPNVPSNMKLAVPLAAEDWRPLTYLGSPLASPSGHDLPFVLGDRPESVEAEPNDERAAATPLAPGSTVNGRFETSDDVDWYRLPAKAKDVVQLETFGHRFLRSPVDTLVRVYDPAGKIIAENDDDPAQSGYESIHDYQTTDSKLKFTPEQSGDHWLEVRQQGEVFGPRAVYRLIAGPMEPDIELIHFPDGVPIWGPGSTAAFLVKLERTRVFSDVELSVEGLPEGWIGSKSVFLGKSRERSVNPHDSKAFLTITAPSDARPGDVAKFHVVGRAIQKDGPPIVRRALPLTLFYTSDTGFFRVTPQPYAAVAMPQGPWLEAITSEIEVVHGGSTKIPVRVCGEAVSEMAVNVNLANSGVACGVGPPQTLPVRNGQIEVPLKLNEQTPPGTFGIVVAGSWRSDIRAGMPGPCTSLIQLHVRPKDATAGK